MTTRIQKHSDNYTVSFYTDDILTTVTNYDGEIDRWVKEILRIHRCRLSRLVVGIDAEWRPSFSYDKNPTALLQICVGRRCLIIKLLYIDYLPQSLHDFLADHRFTFVGVMVGGDVRRLAAEKCLYFGRVVDLRALATQRRGRPGTRRCGLPALAMEVMGVEMSKPPRVGKSNWGNDNLSLKQIEYACVHAFVSFEIGRILRAYEVSSPPPTMSESEDGSPMVGYVGYAEAVYDSDTDDDLE